MDLNPVDLRDALTLGVLALTFVGLLGLVGNVALMDIRRELRRLRRDIRTTTLFVRQAADDDHQPQQDLSPRAIAGSTQPTSKEEHA